MSTKTVKITRGDLAKNDLIFITDYTIEPLTTTLAIVRDNSNIDEIFVEELWNNKDTFIGRNYTGLQYYHTIKHNFGQVMPRSLEKFMDEFPEYFV